MKKFVLLFLLFIPFYSSFAQVKTRNLANLSFNERSAFPYSNINCKKAVQLPALDYAEIAKLTDTKSDSLAGHRFGKGTEVSLTLDDGQWTDVDGGRLWMMSFESENALSLNFVFNNFRLAKDSKLYITNDEKNILYGPVTAESIPDSERFLTDIIKGNKATIYLYEPYGQEESRLSIEKVVQGFKNPYIAEKGTEQLTSGSDFDVACYSDWEKSSDGVAFIIGADGESSYSGSLLMTTDYSFRPYVLTTSSCLLVNNAFDSQSASDLFFKFRAKKATCGGTQEVVSYSYNGATCRADSPNYIFVLLEISHDVKLQSDIAWLGWDRSTAIPSSASSIYHGSTDNLLKLSFDYDTLLEYGGDNWRYRWNYGYYVGNKNGAPLLNPSKRVIGYQVSNGIGGYYNGVFDFNRYATFEKMNVIWTGGGTDDSRLSNWLDPIGTNQSTMDSYYPMSIQGAAYPCGEELYLVANLPSDCTVTWSIPGASSAVASMLQSNTPQQNQCTITNSSNLEFDVNLVAQVKRNGITILTLSKNIKHLGFSGSYSQTGRTFHGVTYHDIEPTSFGNNALLMVNQYCEIKLHSSHFASSTITYTGETPTILTSPNNETIRMIISSTSSRAVTTVNVSGGNCDNYQFTIWAYKAPNLPNYLSSPSISASKIGDGYVISLLDIDKREGESANNMEWNLTIVNSITGDKVFQCRQTEGCCTVNTVGWEPGVYIVTGEFDGKVSTIKITI